MGAFLVNPRYALHLWRQGLRTAADYLACADGHLISKHRRRGVTLVNLGGVSGYLKRQDRIPARERLASWWAGFGPCSQALREWQTLSELREHGALAPEPMAVGEAAGGAFVLVRALPEAVDLPTYLAHQPEPAPRRQAILKIAEALATLHALGYSHPDLFAKHVFLKVGTLEASFIDFQRTRRHMGGVPWRQRCRDLAALDASLPPEAAASSDRLRFLAHYLEYAEVASDALLRDLRERIQRRSAQLARRSKLKRLRATALDAVTRPPAESTSILMERVRVAAPRGAEPVFAALSEGAR